MLPAIESSLGKVPRVVNNPAEGAGITAVRECIALKCRKHFNYVISHYHRMTGFNTTANVHMDGHKGLDRLLYSTRTT